MLNISFDSARSCFPWAMHHSKCKLTTGSDPMPREDALNEIGNVYSTKHRRRYEGILKGGETQGAADAKKKTGFCSDAALLAAGVGAMRTRINKNVEAGRNISLILCRKCQCPSHGWTIGAPRTKTSKHNKYVYFELR